MYVPMASGECSAWCCDGGGGTGERVRHLPLEVDDQTLGLAHEPPVLDRSRRDAPLDALDEDPEGFDEFVEGAA